MDKKIVSQLDNLRRRITSGDYRQELRGETTWGGADVVIAKTMDSSLKKWLGDQPIVISHQMTAPRRHAVITNNVCELIWLFGQLSQVFGEMIDATTKYDFYGTLAQSAIDHLGEKGDKIAEEMLLAVIDATREFAKTN